MDKLADILQHIDDFDIGYYDSLSDADKKAFSPFMATALMGSTRSVVQTKQLSMIANPLILGIPAAHKALAYKLLCVASDGQRERYRWCYPKADKSKPLTTAAVRAYYNCSTRHAKEYMVLLSGDDIIELAGALGYQDDILAKIKNEQT